ncbi:hypothetical protein GM418_10880 [Maribellus comscasis]|uniref:HK97 gp10 family phage protein n=1 Tax=Maribellus comscasis TaxID=2681766 RepID=A0A6I6K2K2_9BACT|nr:hypothetical protein [Maribellus comscasis]QGY44144.1 hypothetical protein GM418_10880 [Maribellus comscasis]
MKGKMIVTNMGAMFRALDKQVKDAEWQTQQLLKYAGEQFLRRARLNKEFKDDTGNLQSSIGYVVAKNRRIIINAIEGLEPEKQTAKGKTYGVRLAEAIIADYPMGYVLVGVAGMEYGVYVEANGKDVITGSIPQTKKLIREIMDELKK